MRGRASAERRPNASRIRSGFGRNAWHEIASCCGCVFAAHARCLRRQDQCRAADGRHRAGAAPESDQFGEGPLEASEASGRTGRHDAALSHRSLSVGTPAVNHFQYKNGVLSAEDVPLTELAEAVGTPFYCYSTATLTRHYKVFESALPKGSLIAFSVKANGNIAVLKTLGKLGAGADVVSGGELKKALAAGIPANRIVFSGVGKTREEMRLALEAGIYQFNVEGEPELAQLSEVAGSMNARAPVTIRVNPDVDAKTHAKITTGTYETKFGIPWSRARQTYAHAAKLKGIDIVGVDVHIGSQITDLGPFRAALGRAACLITELRADGHRILRADLGGGLGVPYRLG